MDRESNNAVAKNA